ncbi:hypothetical protein HB848_12685 [Listeria rocourtiae]|uniref:hypothetical protein n=1 Tax=Listeria rocourtiae TaxID=647910 RepID=UPI001624EEDA|nr:hypothetical protein [Listeria rocourtiae]MBC1436196.1 hypothetical protein [Listeria rocourtiae]
MYFKYFFISGAIGAILLFIIQAINFLKKIAIQGGLMNGDTYPGLFDTGLMTFPIIFFCISFIFLYQFYFFVIVHIQRSKGKINIITKYYFRDSC